MNRIIKLQEEEYPLSSPELDNAFFNHCLTTFYDRDSQQEQEIIHAKCSAHEVLCHLERTLDLCDTPLPDILAHVANNPTWKGVDLELLRRKLRKHKHALKRQRAKNRDRSAQVKKLVLPEPTAGSEEQEEEFKKQRNRMSAQISRDRKKEKVRQLEELHRQLKQQYDRSQQENEKLRQQVEINKQQSVGVLSNRVTQLLILLGVVFLFGVIRDIFKPQPTRLPIVALTHHKPTALDTAVESRGGFVGQSEEERQRILDSIEGPLEEIMEDRSLLGKVKQAVSERMISWSADSWLVPQSIREKMRSLQSLVSL